MEFIQYTINWVKGEIFEAIIIAIIGAVIVLCSGLFWKFGTTPYAKALVIPLLIVGMIPLFMGISGAVKNYNRISYFEKSWQQDNDKFIVAEKERVESFDEIFKYSYPAAIIFVIGGAILFFLVSSPTWKAICLSMMVIGLMAYFVDHFAAEREDIYLKNIKSALKTYK